MENFNQIFTLIAENKGISLNSDILETGVINIALLVGILVYTGKDFLGSLLEERKTIIVNPVIGPQAMVISQQGSQCCVPRTVYQARIRQRHR